MNKMEELGSFSAATIHEALGRYGNLPSAIKPIHPKMKVCGPAYTVMTMPRDNVLLHRAYAYAKPGDVIVADGDGVLVVPRDVALTVAEFAHKIIEADKAGTIGAILVEDGQPVEFDQPLVSIV